MGRSNGLLPDCRFPTGRWKKQGRTAPSASAHLGMAPAVAPTCAALRPFPHREEASSRRRSRFSLAGEVKWRAMGSDSMRVHRGADQDDQFGQRQLRPTELVMAPVIVPAGLCCHVPGANRRRSLLPRRRLSAAGGKLDHSADGPANRTNSSRSRRHRTCPDFGSETSPAAN